MNHDSGNNREEKGAKVTVDHEVIREWAEERGGAPSVVKSAMDDEDGILRLDFGEKEAELEPVSWDEFFRIFEDKNLAFLYQDKTADGSISRFFKFIDRDNSDNDGEDETAEDEEILEDEF